MGTEWVCEYEQCENKVRRLPSDIENTRRRFCSQSCSAKARESRRDRTSSKKCSQCGELKDISSFGKSSAKKKHAPTAECKQCISARHKEYNKTFRANPNAYLKRFQKHGITEEIFNETVRLQGGGCGICGSVTDILAIDHDHSHCPGAFGCSECFRGALCGRCNPALGGFRDDVALLPKAIEFLSSNRSRLILAV